MVEEIQKKLQAEIDKFKQVQKDYHKTLSKRQHLDSQLNESTVVKEELDFLKSENEVYKLIGPVLVKQDIVEAKENINKRLEFITSEIKRTDDLIATLDKKQESHKVNLEALQQIFQQSQVKSAKP